MKSKALFLIDIEYTMRDANYFGQFSRHFRENCGLFFFLWKNVLVPFHVVYAYIIGIIMDVNFTQFYNRHKLLVCQIRSIYFLIYD